MSRTKELELLLQELGAGGEPRVDVAGLVRELLELRAMPLTLWLTYQVARKEPDGVCYCNGDGELVTVTVSPPAPRPGGAE